MRSLFRVGIIILICALLQQGAALLAILVRAPVEFKHGGVSSVTADLSHLAPGRYFLSVGRVLGETEVQVDGRVVEVSTITLGAPIWIKSSGELSRLAIGVRSDSWRDRLYDFPIIAPYGAGIIVQAWRVFSGIYMGPIFCILLLISAITHAQITTNFSKRLGQHVAFGITAFFYTFYLSGIPDLFWNVELNTVIQILLRVAFSAAVLNLLGARLRNIKFVIWAHLPCALVAVIAFACFYGELVSLYKVELWIFVLLSGVVAFQLKSKEAGHVRDLSADFAVAWTLIQAFSTIAYLKGTLFLSGAGASYLSVWSPSFVAMLAIYDFYLLSSESIEFAGDVEAARRSYQLALQVSHDIRSPLAALDTFLSDVHGLSGEQAQMINSATVRIRDIANDLLSYPKSDQHNRNVSKDIAKLLNDVVTEKRAQFRDRSEIKIEAMIPPLASSWHIYASKADFSRVISNLVNNAVEATAAGVIHIGAEQLGDSIVISVCDPGRGIPPEVLKELGRRKISHGKSGQESGSGIGVLHARTSANSWGGQLEIESEVGKGTLVRLILPRAIQEFGKSVAILLDDDLSMHTLWKIAARRAGKQLICFSSREALEQALEGFPKEAEFFIDGNLGANRPSGVDVAKSLYEKGYRNLHLATGERPDQFKDIVWLKSIRGKTPPWI